MKKMFLIMAAGLFLAACGSKEDPRAIKGLTPYDVTKNFENNGFVFEKAITEFGTSNRGTKAENGITYIVSSFGSNSQIVESISADVIINGDKNISAGKQFLKFTSTLPYDNSNPEYAAKWVEKYYDTEKQDTLISGVKFTILAPSKTVRRLLLEKEL